MKRRWSDKYDTPFDFTSSSFCTICPDIQQGYKQIYFFEMKIDIPDVDLK